MGNSSQNGEQFNTDQWLRVADSSNLVTLWENKNNRNYHIEEHKVYTMDKNQLQQEMDLYYWRKHHPRLVATLYFEEQSSEEFCVSRSVAHLFLQKIPLRLNDLSDLPLPDVIHCYDQCLNGFQELSKEYGCFRVLPQYIGINEQGVVKVWAGGQWSQVTVMGGKISEQEMVRSIVECIEGSSDLQAMQRSGMPIRNYLYRGTDKLNFHRALYQLKNYTQLTNIGGVPSRLQSLYQAKDFQQFMEPLLRSNHDLNLTHNRNQISNLTSTSNFPSQTNLYKVELNPATTPASYETSTRNWEKIQENSSMPRYDQFSEHPPVRSQIQTNYCPHPQPQPVLSAVTFSPIAQHPQPQSQFQPQPQSQSQSQFQPQPQSHITYPSNYTFNNKSGGLSNQFSANPGHQLSQNILRPQVNFNGSSASKFQQIPPSSQFRPVSTFSQHSPNPSTATQQVQPSLPAQDEHSRSKKPIPESIIMQLYRSEDRFGNNDYDMPMKEFGLVKKAESIMEQPKKFQSATLIKEHHEGNPLFGFPQNPPVPSYLQSIQELSSQHWKNDHSSSTTPNRSGLNYKSIDPSDGKSSAELLNYLKFGL